jgi:Zn-dependent peptidase ImmA (M78 family)
VVLHRHVTQEQIEDPKEHKRIEREANQFAGAFTMPAASFAYEVSSARIDQFLELKSRWRMSIAAMVFRCSELSIFNETQTLNLQKEISRRKWRTREPLDEDIRFEHQGMLRRGLNLVLDAGETTPEALLRQVGLSPEWIERLTGFPSSSFVAAPVEPVHLELSKRSGIKTVS